MLQVAAVDNVSVDPRILLVAYHYNDHIRQKDQKYISCVVVVIRQQTPFPS